GAPPESAMLTLYTASGMVIGGTGESAQWIGRTRAIPDAKDALPAPYVASDLAAGTYRLRMMRAPWALIIDARDKNPGTVEWQRMTKTIAGALVSLIPGLLLAGLLSRRMTVSLERLGEGARRVAAGNLDYRLTEGTTREASVVAAEFNQMADRLQERQRQLAASEARFRSLTALSSDWYWEQDEHYRFTGLSRELHGKAGIGVEEHIGKTRWDLP